MGASEIISLLGGIALFLFGMAIMGDGLKKVAGSKLELVLYKLTSTPLKGVLLGTGVTAVIQSSSATSVMVVGFVNSGMMKVNQAIGIVMGAILGTSVTGWILCLSSLSGGSGWVTLLSTATLTGLVAVVGIILRMAAKRPATHHVGDILLGFAVLMYGMSIMSDAVSPLRDSQVFIDALTSFSNPLLGILVGLLFTSVIQSASAAVGILQALAVTGAITFEIALPIVMGIAIGAAVPVLGFGWLPALIALALYGILPVLQGTLAGLGSIPPGVSGVAEGMGMTGWQRLYKVELPLAAPVILAGIRTSVIVNIGTATIASTVGASTLGTPIIIGLSGFNTAYIVQGALLVALAAIIVDRAFERLTRWISRHRHAQ